MGEETVEEMLARLRKEQNIEVLPESEVDPESGLTFADKARLAATGLLFNYADEAIAGIKALSPDVTYEDALSEERSKLKSAQSKDGSLKYEIGGAIVPTAVATLAAPFTGGTSLAATAPTWMRLLGYGAAQGFLSGTGSSEEEGFSRIKDAPVATLTGAVANPLFAKLTQATQVALTPILDSVKRTLTGKVGKKVEDELIRMISDSGLTVDDFLQQVNEGKILPEMSEEAAKVVSGFASKAGPGSPIIRDAVTGRKNRFVKDLYERLQNDLDPESQGGNIFKTFYDDTEKLLKAEGEAYKQIWESTSGQTFKPLDQTVLFMVRESRSLRNLINKGLDESGIPQLFKSTGKGKPLELNRSLTLEEGEIIKRVLMDVKNKAFRSGTGNKATTFENYEKEIKSVLDQISPELQATRQNWAIIKNSVEMFDEGKKVFSKDPEEFAVQFDNLVKSNDVDAIEALRSGAASALKRKSQSSQKIGTITSLADAPDDLNKKERVILEILYPGDKIETIISKINQARGSIFARGKTFDGSDSGERLGSASRVGLGQDAADLGRIIMSNGLDVRASANIITRMFGGKKPPFTDNQYKEIAQLVVSENADLLKKSLTDNTSIDAIYNAFAKAINAVSASQPRVIGSTKLTEGVGDIYDPVVSGALDGLIQTISPKTKDKILTVSDQN